MAKQPREFTKAQKLAARRRKKAYSHFKDSLDKDGLDPRASAYFYNDWADSAGLRPSVRPGIPSTVS
jgi:hypothetical protein